MIAKYLTFILLFLYVALLLVNINYVPTVIGDENTYSSSIWSLIDGRVNANNHPLLAKTIWLFFVFIGNGFFGSNAPLFWRVGTIILSAGTLVVFYNIAQNFFSSAVSLIATIFLAIDPMYFAFGRLIHLEIPALFFLLMSLYFFLEFDKKQKFKFLVFSSLFLGLSLAAKLMALGVFSLLLAYLLVIKFKTKYDLRTAIKNSLAFFALTISSFVLGNIVFFFKDSGGTNFLSYTFDLIRTQTFAGLESANFQNSTAWSWFAVPQIISLYRLNFQDRVESIIAFQNPIFFALTLTSFFYLSFFIFNNFSKNKPLMIVLMYFIGLYFFWFLGLHGTYYYYIVPILPFSILMATFLITKISKYPEKILIKMLPASILVFAFVYPLLAGINIPKKYDLLVYKYSLIKYPEINTLFCQNCFPRK